MRTTRFRSLGLPLLLASLLAPCWALAETSPTLGIKATRLLDVKNGKIIDDPVVVVQGERILSVGSGSAKADRILDLGDVTLLPGLIDGHVHIAAGGGLDTSVARGALKGAANARKTLLTGFTTVRSMAGSGFAGIALRDAIADGDVIGPRLYDAGTLLAVTGGHCSGPVLAPEFRYEASGVADSPAAFVRKVREQFKYGADFIKICITGGFVSGTDPTISQFSEEEIRAVIDTAHRYGKKVAVHAHGADAIRTAARLGADSIEHASLVDDEGIALIKANKHAVVVPTLSPASRWLQRAKEVGATPYTLAVLEQTSKVHKRNIEKIIKAGIPIVYGTDGPAGENYAEFPYLVAAGLSNLQAIQAATVNAARWLNADNDLGSIEAGKFADIIAVNGNPLEQLDTLERVGWVMKGGVIYKE
ncbi:amidohydrolase family protein [Aquipseudomonas campi]